MGRTLFELNPSLDREALAENFAEHRRVQVRDLLTREAAEEIQSILMKGTPWGMAVRAGNGADTPPRGFSNAEIAAPGGAEAVNRMANAAAQASARGDYGFRYAQFSLVEAVQNGWNPGGPHELLLEYLNAPEMMEFVRAVTGFDALAKADAQATMFAPQHYLGRHSDSHVEEGWKVAYVMNFAREDWHPDWGGYLLFLDEDGDVVQGFRPRFNALNMFAVPQTHLVTYVPPFAPAGRLAITGWFRDR
ncbi:2OG-Fe(II) oxygenase [Alteriqipengyuania sp. 357]